MTSHHVEETWRTFRELPWMLSRAVFPLFVGDDYAEAFLDWEMKVDQVLVCFDYDDYKKVKMVTYKFTRYVLVWWSQFCMEIREGRMKHADMWADLSILCKDLYNKLQCMYQGSKSIEEYHKDMEVTLLMANVLKSNEETMTHFLHRPNKDIQDVVELYHYTSMDDLVHQVIQIKAQQKRHLTLKKTYPNGPNNWRGKENEKERPRKDKSPKKESFLPEGRREERTLPSPAPMSKNSNIKCFKCFDKGHIASQCANKMSMIL
ncbi:hypothetical protein CR513_49333, partial [Mucuna pruriens]